MSILNTYTHLQELNATITGIKSAPTGVPTSLNSADLPCCICIPGPATWNLHAVGSLRRQVRTYYLRVYVKPVAQGAGIDEGFQDCLPIMQEMGATYLAQANSNLSGEVDAVGRQPPEAAFSDGGVRGDLSYAGITYHGFEFALDITEKGTT